MGKKMHFVNAAVFSGIILIIGFFLISAPRPEFSENERRELEKFPEFTINALLSGEYTRKIGIFFSDTVPLREDAAEVSAFLKNLMGIRFDNVTLHNITLSAGDYGSTAPENTVTEAVEQSKPDIEKKNTVIYESADENPINSEFIPKEEPSAEKTDNETADIRNNGILVYKNRGLMLYGGNKEAGERYAAALNAYRKTLEDDVRIYSMLVPTSVEFYCPDNYKNLSGSQRENINHITSLLDEGITAVNVYSALFKKKEEDIYFRTDHHWSPLGAFYAAEEFCKKSNTSFPALSEYKVNIIPGYVGTLYGYSGDIVLKNNPEDFIYYKPENSYSTTYYNYDNPSEAIYSSLFLEQSVGMSYCIFMGGDSKITHIQTDINNGRVLTIFKDSYGNALVPFLVNSFEEIFVIDIRYFPYKAIEYLNQNKVTDVLFCNNIFSANTASLISCIEEIMR